MMPDALSALREEFPLLETGTTFLDWAATGLLPRVSRSAVEEYLRQIVDCPTAESTWMHGVHGQTRQRVRVLTAGLLGGTASASDVALVESTTAGLNIATSVLPAESGDNVVLSAIDYLAVAMPWKRRADREGLKLRFVPAPEGRLRARDLLASADARTRAIAVSTAAWTTGALLDAAVLAEGARKRGIPLILDAVQTFGVVPLDVGAIPTSFLCVGGHKWLCSPLGAGFLYVSREAAERRLPDQIGFLAGQPERGTWPQFFESPDASPAAKVRFPPAGRSFEVGGTANYPGALGLLGMLRLLSQAGVAELHEHVLDLGDHLIDGLKALGHRVVTPTAREERAGIVVFQTGAGVGAEQDLVLRLRERRIVGSVRYTSGQGGVRISLHGMNTMADVETLLRQLGAP
jgi:selenocysteine lyase/cysteine desulfurase